MLFHISVFCCFKLIKNRLHCLQTFFTLYECNYMKKYTSPASIQNGHNYYIYCVDVIHLILSQNTPRCNTQLPTRRRKNIWKKIDTFMEKDM
jgi:hypothetical protein